MPDPMNRNMQRRGRGDYWWVISFAWSAAGRLASFPVGSVRSVGLDRGEIGGRSSMTCHLFALCFDANDPPRLARFWAGLLGWENADDLEGGMALLPTDDTGFGFRFRPTREQKTGQNPTHFHLTSTSLEDQQQTVARSLGLGARHIDVGQRPDEGHVVLADPEGNEFCVIEPGNKLPGRLRILRGDHVREGSPEVGTSGARRSGGRWSGIGTRRPRYARRTAARRSAGTVSGSSRRPERTGIISTSLPPSTVISTRRPTGCR